MPDRDVLTFLNDMLECDEVVFVTVYVQILPGDGGFAPHQASNPFQ